MKETALQFTIQLEAALRRKIEELSLSAPENAKPLLDLVIAFELRVEDLLILPYDVPPDLFELLGEERLWIESSVQMLSNHYDRSAILILLLSLVDLTERSARYYHQASANSAMPHQRYFYSSLTEAKKMLKRKLEQNLRSVYNEIWAQTGFAPFDSTRE